MLTVKGAGNGGNFPPGKEKLYPTVDDWNKKADGFDDWCKENGYLRTLERFYCFMGIVKSTVWRYEKLDGFDKNEVYDEQQDFKTPIENMKQRFLADLVEGSLTGSLRDAPSIFNMKNNYGYTDKQEIKADMEISINMGDYGEYAE